VLDVGAANVALVFKDNDTSGGDTTSDGVGAPDFYVRANNFGAGDMVYVDNQNPAASNRLDSTTVLADTPPNEGVTTLSFAGSTGGLGGVIEIDLAGTNGTFTSLEQLKNLLGVAYQPVGERAAAVTIQSLTISNFSSTQPPIAAEGTQINYQVTLTGAAPAGGFAVDWRAVAATTGDPAEPQDLVGGSGSAFPSGFFTIAAGQTTGTFTVTVADDTLAEPQEGFLLQVGKMTSGVFTSAAERFTGIRESDQPPPGDTTPPTLTITPSVQGGKILAGQALWVDIIFTEAVTGFDLGDVAVSGGVLSNLSKSSDTDYWAVFEPTAGVDGMASFNVAAGAFSDAAGNASTAAAGWSGPLRTVQPGNSGGTMFTEPPTGTSVINVRFSEPIFEKTAGASISGFSLTLNPSSANNFQGTGTAPQITGFTLGEGSPANGYTLLTLQTNTVFAQGDVVRVNIYGYGTTNFQDPDGNNLAYQEIHIGGSDSNTINLDGYYGNFLSRQILRGNGGDDTLTGTNKADSLIDGGGADVMRPSRGGDSITLVENGGTGNTPIPYARDEILIGLGDTRRGVDNTDAIRFDVSNSASGFDWFSSDSAAHDVLKLESGVIAQGSSFKATPTAQGTITGHTLAAGIVTFKDASGNTVDIRQDNTSLSNALDYLRVNLQAAGHTVAFKADYDNNGSVEALFVYQDMGTLPLAGNAEMPDIVVFIEQPGATAADRLASVTLGNAPGANVLEIQDGFSPKALAFGLTANGVALNFAEPMYAPATVGSLAMSLQVNGTGTVYTPSSVSGLGTAALVVQASGLSMSATDWALVTYAGSTSANALTDAAGKLLTPGNASNITFALGSSGNSTIDLSTLTVTSRGLEIDASAGDDLVIGTSSQDTIKGGAGADTLRGGAGDDTFNFAQGDSPVLTLNTSGVTDLSTLTGATYTFAGGKAEVIESLQTGDSVWLSPPLDGATGSNDLDFFPGFDWGNTMRSGEERVPGLVMNQAYFGVGGTLGANGVFTVGSAGNSPDTLVVYDGDGSSSVSQTGFVLKGMSLESLQGFTYDSQLPIRLPLPVNGTEGNDTLDGTDGPDVLNGLGGRDILEGDSGNDTMTGGGGNDVFQYYDYGNAVLLGASRRKEHDTITDFGAGDSLRFSSLRIDSLTEGANAGGLMRGQASIIVGAGQTTLHIGMDSISGVDLSITLTGSFQASGFSLTPPHPFALSAEIRYASGELFVGTAGNDTRNGGDGNDTLEGREGDDILSGVGGDDTLVGGAGNDLLYGGAGIDLARYVGVRADYNVVFADDALTLTDTVLGRDGVDTVYQVERFDFAGVFYVHVGLGQLLPESASP
jgi:Ca2+-binding RTX toxin-like protein